MLTRRMVLLAALVPGWLIARLSASEPEAGLEPEIGQDIADLKTQLNSGLRCRRDIEFQFIDLIVQMTNNGQLSVELVKGTFQWARKKKPYPFPYFERAIRARAAEDGVTIP